MRKIYLCGVLTAVMGFLMFAGDASMAVQKTFWTEAAQGGMAEIALGNMAMQRSQSAEIKQFAEKMVTDHTAANQELMMLASSKNVTLPSEVNDSQRKKADKLMSMSGEKFDKEFMKTVVEDHEKSVALYRRTANSDADADAKAFAAKTLPTLEGHLSMARNMAGMKMKNKDMNMDSDRRDMNMNSNDNMNSNRNTNRNSNSNSNNRNTNSNSSNRNSNNSNRDNR